jgi:hypothetical protein
MMTVAELEKWHDLTWERLVELEPRLEALLMDVQATRPHRKRGFNYEVAWGQFKQPIATLVGWHRWDNCDPIIKTQKAYDVAYWKLWYALHE